jgi:hypothetical protein
MLGSKLFNKNLIKNDLAELSSVLTLEGQRLGLETLSPDPIRHGHNPFQKRLERKPQETFGFADLIPKPYQRAHKPFKKRLERK